MAPNDDTRAQLVDAARGVLRARGYVGLSVKGAAAVAGIAPEVAMRYYQNRDELLAAALRLPFDPASAVPSLVAPGIEGMGERLVHLTMDTLGDDEAREELMGLLQAGASAGKALEGLIDFVEEGIVDRVARIIGLPDARMRSALITSQLVGLAIVRYGMRLEPVASASEDEIVRMYAPAIQELLDPRNPISGYDYAKRGQVPPSETTAAAAASAAVLATSAARGAAVSGAKSGVKLGADAAITSAKLGAGAAAASVRVGRDVASSLKGKPGAPGTPESGAEPVDPGGTDEGATPHLESVPEEGAPTGRDNFQI